MKERTANVNATLIVALRAEADALVAQAFAKRAQADALEAPETVDAPVPLDVAAARTETSEHSLRRWVTEGKLQASRGPRGKYLVRVSDVVALLAAVAVVPRPRKAAPVTDLDAWERETDAELRRLGGKP